MDSRITKNEEDQVKLTYKKSLIAAALSIILSPVTQANMVDSRGIDNDSGQRTSELKVSKRNTDNPLYGPAG